MIGPVEPTPPPAEDRPTPRERQEVARPANAERAAAVRATDRRNVDAAARQRAGQRSSAAARGSFGLELTARGRIEDLPPTPELPPPPPVTSPNATPETAAVGAGPAAPPADATAMAIDRALEPAPVEDRLEAALVDLMVHRIENVPDASPLAADPSTPLADAKAIAPPGLMPLTPSRDLDAIVESIARWPSGQAEIALGLRARGGNPVFVRVRSLGRDRVRVAVQGDCQQRDLRDLVTRLRQRGIAVVGVERPR